MKCPFCGSMDDKVIDTRLSGEGANIRRRRECLKCEKRFTTYEYVEEAPLMIIKRDSTRQRFDREKIRSGITKACEKRPISMEKIEEVIDEIERAIHRKTDKEIKSTVIGNLIMDKLYNLDEVAYVRFASVYRRFKDVSHFKKELEKFLE